MIHRPRQPRGFASLATLGVATASLFYIVNAEVIVGLAMIGFLLFSLIVMRLTMSKPEPRQSRPSLARISMADEEDAPELRVSRSQPKAPPLRNRASRASHSGDDLLTTTMPLNPLSDNVLPSEEEAQAKERTDAKAAAPLWERMGRWGDAARCHLKLMDFERTARLHMALGRQHTAVSFLRQALGNSPTNDLLRERLVEALINEGAFTEAMDLVNAVLKAEEDGGRAVSATFLEAVARDLESLGKFDEAESFYRLVLQKDDTYPEVHQRLQYLAQLRRLSQTLEANAHDSDGPRRFLERLAAESSPEAIERGAPELNHELEGSSIIIGHLALGFLTDEPRHGVGSLYAPSRRFSFDSLIDDTPRSAVFKAVDRLLDFPVAVKLYRLPADFHGIKLLSERLVAVSRLSHPNLAKVIFADRQGSVIRVATEYLPGGNLKDFLHKLGGVGYPLILRMAIQVASALHKAHVRGVPHGDLRPENLIIGPDQRIKIVDFALCPIQVLSQPTPTGQEQDLPVYPRKDLPALFSEAIRSDIAQFATILEFMLEHTRTTADPVRSSDQQDLAGQIRDLVADIRRDTDRSMFDLWRMLQDIFESAMPSGNTPVGGKPRLNI